MISLVRKMPEANEAVRQEFRSGRATLERNFAACSGSLPMAPPDRAEVLAMLISDSDQRISEKSQNALLSVPHAAFIIALGPRGRIANACCILFSETWPRNPTLPISWPFTPSVPRKICREWRALSFRDGIAGAVR